jgi:hypothetical protein
MTSTSTKTRSKPAPVLISMSEASRLMGAPLSEIRRRIADGRLTPIRGLGCRLTLLDASQIMKGPQE